MLLRDFQLCLRQHEPDLYRRCRAIWEPIEFQVRLAIPKRYRFGEVRKVVLELGPEVDPKPHYRVLLGVGLLHYPDFDPYKFLAADPTAQRNQILGIIDSCMSDLSASFKVPIEWLQPVLSATR